MAWPEKGKDRDSLIAITTIIVTGIVACAVVLSEHLKTKNILQQPLTSSNDLSEPLPEAKTAAPEKILKAADHIHDGKHHLLLAATGSVATIKIPNIVHALARHENLSIRIVLSEAAANFLAGQSKEQPSLASIREMPNVDGIYRDADEWRQPWTRGASILHIELRRWADLMVIAPLSANALAKIAAGFSDNLIHSVVRAWDATVLGDPNASILDGLRSGIPLPDGALRNRKGILVAPAMNTAMWNHPATAKHLSILEGEWNIENGGWFEVLRPVEKELACGDTGSGAMKDWKYIVETIELRLGLEGAGEKEVVFRS